MGTLQSSYKTSRVQADQAPTASTILINILRDEYRAFVELLPNDGFFLASYDDWAKRQAEEGAERRRRAEEIKEVVVHPKEFTDFCWEIGLRPNWFALAGLAARKASGPITPGWSAR